MSVKERRVLLVAGFYLGPRSYGNEQVKGSQGRFPELVLNHLAYQFQMTTSWLCKIKVKPVSHAVGLHIKNAKVERL